jgi:cytidine deaminase
VSSARVGVRMPPTVGGPPRYPLAVWRNDQGVLHVLPPCGRCREFIRQIDPTNLDTEVILGRRTSARLRDLLPFNQWPNPLD